jgi:hypothetical protein
MAEFMKQGEAGNRTCEPRPHRDSVNDNDQQHEQGETWTYLHWKPENAHAL